MIVTRPPPSAPQFPAVRTAYCPSDLRLLDRHGEPLHELRIDRTRRRLAWTPLDTVSPPLIAAVVASEDRRFFAHRGVDWRAVAAALWQRLRGAPARGASTITMQLAALLEPGLQRRGAPRSLSDKWRQMRAAWALERTWSKQEILETYLNLVTFRGELQGVGAAAAMLFGKAPHGLTDAESVVLAALIRSPNADREALTRRATALSETSFPPCGGRSGWGAAVGAERLPPSCPSPTRGEGIALSAAIDRAIDTPANGGARLALAPHAAHRLLHAAGGGGCADTPSTLDAATQRVATDALHRQLTTLRDRAVRDAAVLVVDNASGEVLAYVAAGGDLSSARHVDGIQAHRQAGSTLKPFLYGMAFDQRVLTAATLLDDAPLEIPVGTGLYRPRNYDESFRGLVPVRSALAGSLNVPAVRTLLLIGADAFAAQLRELGFAAVDRPGDFYGPSLALGSADVSLWELVNAYRTLANAGTWTPLRMKETDQLDNRSPPPWPSLATGEGQGGGRLYTPAAAFIVSDILADRDSRALTFGLENPLATRFWSAVKTGTSKDMRDNWCVGYSRRYTVGVWVGNFSGAPMHDVSGITGAAPIWAEVMEWLQRDLPSPPPPVPPQLARRAGEWFVEGTAPSGGATPLSAPRIVAPADGSIIALDPDIPAARQRIAFAAEVAQDLRWQLDGTDLAGTADPVLWNPAPGTHILALVDRQAKIAATVRFEVRGSMTPPRHFFTTEDTEG